MQRVPVRTHRPNLALTLACFMGAASLLTGCNSFNNENSGTFAAISAPNSTIRVNQQIQLTTHWPSPGSVLTFYVNGVPGGNAELGTIDANGMYTAPAIVPVPNSVMITSVATGHPDFPPGSVALGVLNPIPVLGNVTPSGFPEGTTTVDVAGSQFVYGAQILWNGTPVPTTFVSGNQLEAS